MVFDNYSCIVVVFNNLTTKYGRDTGCLRVWFNDQSIYLFYDCVHLVKNLKNNLLTRKQLLFLRFIWYDMEHKLKIAGEGISGS